MNNKVLFGVMYILFNSFGVPQFMQKQVGKGILNIALSWLTCGIGGVIISIIGIVKGIKVLTMSEEAYAEAYLNK